MQHKGEMENLVKFPQSMLAGCPVMCWQMCHHREICLWFSQRSTDYYLLPQGNDTLVGSSWIKIWGPNLSLPPGVRAGVGGSTWRSFPTCITEHLPRQGSLLQSICALSPSWWLVCTKRTEGALPMHFKKKKRRRRKLKPEEEKKILGAFWLCQHCFGVGFNSTQRARRGGCRRSHNNLCG